MSVWFILPARRNEDESTIPAWKEAGYNVAIVRERELPDIKSADLIMPVTKYPGWARSVNQLVRKVASYDQGVRWFVLGGDDTLPDPTSEPAAIAGDSEVKFHCAIECMYPPSRQRWTYNLPSTEYGTFGVMQPTGDDWSDSQGRIIERVAGSPWIGRSFALRSYCGDGPLYSEYFHVFADEELQLVATKLGCFWQRPDLTHKHLHWARPRASREDMPEWAKHINSPEEWRRSSAIFQARKAAGFPGSGPC